MPPRDPQHQPGSLPHPVSQIVEVLQRGDIIEEHGIMRWSSNYAFLVTVCLGEIEVTAVYKPQKGERPLWDFPDGTLCYREQASFLTSEALGWDIVPPTALREGRRGLGSFQYFIDHDPQVNYFSFDETMQPQLKRIAIFDVIVNNADRKGGHCLLDSTAHLWGIDHGITFNSAHKLRTVIWDFAGQRIPDELLHDLECLNTVLLEPESEFRLSMLELLSANEMTAFQNRLRQVLRIRKYPVPGSGPNYPWPPV